MYLKLLICLICLAVIVAVCLTIDFRNNTSAKTESTSPPTVQLKTQNQSAISSQSNSNEISDRLAYTLFFRFLSVPPQQQNDNIRRIRTYLEQKGLTRRSDETCPTRPTDESVINALLGVVAEFQQRVGAIDEQASLLKRQNRTNANPAIKIQLAQLQQQKEAIVDEIISSLPRRIGSDAANELQRFVRDHVKKSIQIH